jgi:hypothetical protein
LDIEIFTLLKVQAIEVFAFLLIVRDFANGKGLQQDVDRINASIAENKHILAIANNQICDLKKLDINNRMGFFDTINPL